MNSESIVTPLKIGFTRFLGLTWQGHHAHGWCLPFTIRGTTRTGGKNGDKKTIFTTVPVNWAKSRRGAPPAQHKVTAAGYLCLASKTTAY